MDPFQRLLLLSRVAVGSGERGDVPLHGVLPLCGAPGVCFSAAGGLSWSASALEELQQQVHGGNEVLVLCMYHRMVGPHMLETSECIILRGDR